MTSSLEHCLVLSITSQPFIYCTYCVSHCTRILYSQLYSTECMYVVEYSTVQNRTGQFSTGQFSTPRTRRRLPSHSLLYEYSHERILEASVLHDSCCYCTVLHFCTTAAKESSNNDSISVQCLLGQHCQRTPKRRTWNWTKRESIRDLYLCDLTPKVQYSYGSSMGDDAQCSAEDTQRTGCGPSMGPVDVET